ncbi:DUF1462 family protein [Kroppenstedtia pulmonis]|uniref:DUF1462 family protein n=1 Tax=Kroppenstedtia pulmonis TaxID=1380685 RepID=A0A7D4BIP1_9BACL|nr:DUF1462 family protein [Kroppenstedtia pulmonis]QKG83770.1 DUF1462 family protein [Kroppenstedtia pulmonis]
MSQPTEVLVYGAEERCASCVNLPSAEETASWLQAALGRKYGDQVQVRYVDIYQPNGAKETAFSRRVLEEDIWYPVIVIQDEIVGEGSARLKDIQNKLEETGVTALTEKSL